MEEVFGIVEKAIDIAFLEQKYPLNFYAYLLGRKTKRKEVKEFIDSHTTSSIKHQIEELNLYIKGNKTMKEAYGYLSKPTARKIKTYLEKIVSDADKYYEDRRHGRRKLNTTGKSKGGRSKSK